MSRTALTINLNDEERKALRMILLEEDLSMAEFFGRYARKYIAQKRKNLPTDEKEDSGT